MAKAIEALASRGLELSWGHYLGDDRALITATIKRTLAMPDVVFSFGGIGATPDDHTRQCAAAAAGVDLKLHPDAEAETAWHGEVAVVDSRSTRAAHGGRIAVDDRIESRVVGDEEEVRARHEDTGVREQALGHDVVHRHVPEPQPVDVLLDEQLLDRKSVV